MGNPRATLDLCAALNDPAFIVRMSAASALGQLGDRAAVAPLIAMLDNRNQSLRDAAANSLGRLRDPRAVEPLIAALEDENREMAATAAQALGSIGDERAAAPLLRMYHSASDELRATLVGALANLDTPEVEKFLKATLKGKGHDLVGQARMYFIRHGDDEALPQLVAALNDSSAWTVARDYLQSGNPTLMEAVRQWAADNDVDLDSLRDDDGEAVAWGSQP
jgi:HEAT repeat protein